MVCKLTFPGGGRVTAHAWRWCDTMVGMKAEKFKEYIQLRRAVRIRPKHATDQTLHGFPLVLSDNFVVLQEIREFHLDGYAIVPLKSIYAVRSGPVERAIERVLQGEGIYDKVSLPYALNLDSFADVFRSLQQTGKNIIIEVLEFERQYINEDFVIGKIVGMSPRSVAILNFDDTGICDIEPTVISYKNIKWISFDSEYINLFSKYLR